jgi:hypothetical protein
MSPTLFEADFVNTITNLVSYTHCALLSANVRKFRGIKLNFKLDSMKDNETRFSNSDQQRENKGSGDPPKQAK